MPIQPKDCRQLGERTERGIQIGGLHHVFENLLWKTQYCYLI